MGDQLLSPQKPEPPASSSTLEPGAAALNWGGKKK